MYNEDVMSEKYKWFLCVYAMIFAINAGGIIISFNMDRQFEKEKAIIESLKENDKSENILEDKIKTCEYVAKKLAVDMKVLVYKILIGMMVSLIVFVPNQIYKLIECDILLYLVPDDIKTGIIFFFVVIMTGYNIISPIYNFADYYALMNEAKDLLLELKFDELINSVSNYSIT